MNTSQLMQKNCGDKRPAPAGDSYNCAVQCFLIFDEFKKLFHS